MTRRLLITTTLMVAGLATLAAQSPTKSGSSRRMDYLAGYLSLTDAQKTAAQAIFDAADTAATTAQGQMAAAQTALKTAIKTTAADAELDRLSAAIGTIQGQVTAIRAKAEAKFYALLTAEQKAKYDQMGASAGGGPGGRGPRGRFGGVN
jgi:Spy/CpxP family protein refolding chaperone